MLSNGLTKSFVCLLAFTSVFTLWHNFATAESSSPEISAKSAVLMEQQSGRLLLEKNPHEKMRIASTTKIMTAVIAVESGKMDEKVPISKKAAYTEGSSLYIKPGQTMRLEDLVYGLMLRSGNDAAVAIAEYIGGSVEGFTYLMNEKAAQIGMTNTLFANPHGLDDHEKMYSTAYDMALLTQYAMKKPRFRKITETKTYRVPNPDGSGEWLWKNKNKLLNRYPYATGGKTGYTRMAKRTLVSTAEKNDMPLIAVTLNDPNDWDDHVNMFEWGASHFEMTTIVDKGIVKGIDNDDLKGNVYTERPSTYPLMKREKNDVTTTVNIYKPPEEGWQKGEAPEPVGKMFVKLNGETIDELPLYFKESGTDENSWWDGMKRIFLATAGVRTDD